MTSLMQRHQCFLHTVIQLLEGTELPNDIGANHSGKLCHKCTVSLSITGLCPRHRPWLPGCQQTRNRLHIGHLVGFGQQRIGQGAGVSCLR